jgi:hypothetical protein
MEPPKKRSTLRGIWYGSFCGNNGLRYPSSVGSATSAKEESVANTVWWENATRAMFGPLATEGKHHGRHTPSNRR